MTVELDIPAEMSAGEFKGLTLKVNKLFNVSQVTTTSKKFGTPRAWVKWTAEMMDILQKNPKKTPKQLVQILNVPGITEKHVSYKRNYLRGRTA